MELPGYKDTFSLSKEKTGVQELACISRARRVEDWLHARYVNKAG